MATHSGVARALRCAAGGAGSAAPGGAFPGGGRGGAGGFSRGGAGGSPGGGFAGGGGTGATVEVQAVTVKSGPLVADRTATGTVAAVMQSNVAAQASGTVKTLLVAAGDEVHAQQPIMQLATDNLELALANAKTSLSNAEINLSTQQTNTEQAVAQLDHQLEAAKSALSAAEANYASAQKVYALGGTSKSSVDSARSQLDQARANVASAENNASQNQRAQTGSLQQLRLAVSQSQNGVKQAEMNLANATIRAPFAGQVAAFNVAPGEYVGPSTAVAMLVSGQRQVQMSVPPSDAAAFTAGTRLSFDTGVAQYPITVTQRPGVPVNQGVAVTARFDATAQDSAAQHSTAQDAPTGGAAGGAGRLARHRRRGHRALPGHPGHGHARADQRHPERRHQYLRVPDRGRQGGADRSDHPGAGRQRRSRQRSPVGGDGHRSAPTRAARRLRGQHGGPQRVGRWRSERPQRTLGTERTGSGRPERERWRGRRRGCARQSCARQSCTEWYGARRNGPFGPS